MSAVDVGISVGEDTQAHRCSRFHHHEAGSEYGSIVVVLIVDSQPVVATHREGTLAVGQLQMVVGVEFVGVERLLRVFNGIAFGKSFHKVAGEKLCGHRPIGLAMLYFIRVAVKLVVEYIEVDVHRLASQLRDRQ